MFKVIRTLTMYSQTDKERGTSAKNRPSWANADASPSMGK
ncbi:hypothetical protein J2S11_003244 [Bacillus horti]|uniref:Uncharacterized protein n=1 Tax=Caldalkalibacillus horti TaxID=77523 RepID=A0ABT9W244_9BACI|nr:hypothetical protein [Bacillus horti]